jgi:general secretion pathway protein D
LGLLLLLAAGPLTARTRKGEKLLKDGRLAETKREYDRAVELYELAVAEDPTDAAYQLALRRVRFQAGQQHVERGLKLRDEGKLEEAAEAFRRGFATDPSSSIAASELKKTLALIEAVKREAGGKKDETGALVDPQRVLEERLSTMKEIPRLKPLAGRVSTLKMNNQPVKVLYETVGKLAGLNVVWDPEMQSSNRNFSIDLSNTSIEDALEHLSVLTKSYWKAISANTIFVTNDNVTKRRDYEDMVVKTFYLRNLTTPQELQEVATILRSVTDIRRVFTYNAQNVIMVRGEVDKVALAEKLVADLDKPKGEVVIDVFVMEANRARTRDLAATFVSGGQNGLRLPISFVPRSSLGTVGTGSATGTETTGTTGTGSTTTTGTGGTDTSVAGLVRLTRLGDIRAEDFAMAIPNALLQALMSDRSTRVLQSPQIRGTHGVKSSLKIGDKYPYATGSFQPGVGAIGVSPLVSTQFQFADVGVNVDVQPIVHGLDEVTLQVEIDVSNIRERIDVGGLSQPVIGQRKFTHNIRLRSGEVSLLGGLRQDQDTKSVSGTPGVGSIPILGRLFSGESVEKSQGELLIALVPHVVRAPDITDLNLRGIAAGTDVTVKLNYTSKPDSGPEKREPAPATPPPATAPAVAAPKPEPPKPEPAGPAKPTGEPKLSFQPASVTARLSQAATVTINLENATDLMGAPLRIKWDPKMLRLNDVTAGTLFASGGQQPIFSRNVRNDEGEVAITLQRMPGATPVSGFGSLVTLIFQAVGQGSTAVSVVEASLRDSKNQPVAVQMASGAVNVE